MDDSSGVTWTWRHIYSQSKSVYHYAAEFRSCFEMSCAAGMTRSSSIMMPLTSE
jgi:hypothetical protein